MDLQRWEEGAFREQMLLVHWDRRAPLIAGRLVCSSGRNTCVLLAGLGRLWRRPFADCAGSTWRGIRARCVSVRASETCWQLRVSAICCEIAAHVPPRLAWSGSMPETLWTSAAEARGGFGMYPRAPAGRWAAAGSRVALQRLDEQGVGTPTGEMGGSWAGLM